MRTVASVFSGRNRIVIPAAVAATIAAVVVVVVLLVSGGPGAAPDQPPLVVETPASPASPASLSGATRTVESRVALDSDTVPSEGELPWVVDGLTDLERNTSESLNVIRRESPDTADGLLRWAWLTDEVTVDEGLVVPLIQDIAMRDDALAGRVVGLPWLADGVSPQELDILAKLNDIALKDASVAGALVDAPWITGGSGDIAQFTLSVIDDAFTDEDSSLAQRIVDSGALADGITSEELARLTGSANYYLERLEREYPATAEILRGHSWVSDGASRRSSGVSPSRGLLAHPVPFQGTSETEFRTLQIMWAIANLDAGLSQRVASLPWVADGVTGDENLWLGQIYRIGIASLDLAAEIVGLPWVSDDLTEREGDALWGLANLASYKLAFAEILGAQAWFQDEITDEERAIVVTLNSGCRNDSRCQGLIDGGQVHKDVLALPTGDVNLLVVSPFEMDSRGVDQLFQGMRQAIAAIEEFMGIPWPERDTIVYLEPGFGTQLISRGFWTDTHFVIGGSAGPPYFSRLTLYHELAHYYFHGGLPFWLVEGGADFLDAYVRHKTENSSIPSLFDGVQQSAEQCDSLGARSLHQRSISSPVGYLIKSQCDYVLGERLLLGLYLGLGHDVVSTSMQELHRKMLQYPLSVTEELPYLTFLSNTPSGRRDEFRQIYQDLHGRPAGYVNPDRPALEALYHATNGDSWADNRNWLRDDGALVEWVGVNVHARNGRVFALDLSDNLLAGPIPPEMGEVAYLQSLRLANNRLTGEVPRELGDLLSLEYLDLLGNQLTGCLPDSLGRARVFSSLPFCGDQQLAPPTPVPTAPPTPVPTRTPTPAPTVPPPPTLRPTPAPPLTGNASGDRAALVALYHATDGPNWADNSGWLTGAPLDEWHGIDTDSNGRVLGIQLIENSLTGPLPGELGDLSALRQLDLRNVLYSCTLERGCEATSPSANRLTGQIPAALGRLTNLEHLNLAMNQLTGEIPSALAGLVNLRLLELGVNQLTGEIPPWLGSMVNLQGLHLAANDFSGNVPVQLGNLSNLTNLQLGHNRLTGSIPASLGKLTGLEYLLLHDNQLVGDIPSELRSLTNLKYLWLLNNRLTGPIPAWLGDFSNLEELLLSDNRLTGSIPMSLGNLSRVNRLYLPWEQLSGCIPTALRRLSDNQLGHPGLSFCGAAITPESGKSGNR